MRDEWDGEENRPDEGASSGGKCTYSHRSFWDLIL